MLPIFKEENKIFHNINLYHMYECLETISQGGL